MKKFIVFIGILFLFASCSTTKFIVNQVGDIALLSDNGQTIRVWKDAILESETVVYNDYVVEHSMKHHKYDDIDVSHKNKRNLIQNKGAFYFWDKNGESHFVDSGNGIVVVSNIHKETLNVTAKEKKYLIDRYIVVDEKLHSLKRQRYYNTDVRMQVKILQTEKKELSRVLWKKFGIDSRKLY